MFLAEQTDPCGECDVYLGSQKRVPVRLIYERVPDAIIAERQGKAKATAKKKGEICAPWVLELLAWTLYVTNIPKTLASAQQVRLLYRLRWQIELIFKLWKSYAKLDVIGIWRIERVWCQVYARLLALLLFQWLAMPYRWTSAGELSLPKALLFLQGKADKLITAFSRSWDHVDHLFQQIQKGFLRFALKQKRRKKPSTLTLLAQPSEP